MCSAIHAQPLHCMTAGGKPRVLKKGCARHALPRVRIAPRDGPGLEQDQACVRGEACPYAHNVFEYWLHPTRYRTQLCNDGEKCARKICFFAHTVGELRTPANKPFVPPEALAAATTTAAIEAARKAAAEAGDAGS